MRNQHTILTRIEVDLRPPVSLDHADYPSGRLLDLWLRGKTTSILLFFCRQLGFSFPSLFRLGFFVIRIIIFERDYKKAELAG